MSRISNFESDKNQLNNKFFRTEEDQSVTGINFEGGFAIISRDMPGDFTFSYEDRKAISDKFAKFFDPRMESIEDSALNATPGKPIFGFDFDGNAYTRIEKDGSKTEMRFDGSSVIFSRDTAGEFKISYRNIIEINRTIIQ